MITKKKDSAEKAEKDGSTQNEGIELNSTVRGIGVKPEREKRYSTNKNAKNGSSGNSVT